MRCCKACKRQKLQRLSKRLELMLSHDCLYLLRNVLAAPRLIYLLRTAPCTGSSELPKFDAVLRESLSTTLNIDLNEDRWTQESQPVRWGDLGIHNVVSQAPSAYFASAACTVELTTSLSPTRLRDVINSGLAIAMSAWIQLATCSTAPDRSVSTCLLTNLGQSQLRGTGRPTT